MKNKFFFVILTTTLLHSQDLFISVKEVIQTNPIILERLENYRTLKEDIQSTKSQYYPKLDISLGLGYEHSSKKNYLDNSTVLDKGKTVDSLGLGVYQNALTYTQNLFNGYSTTFKIEQQEHRAVAAAYSYIEKVNDTAFEMVNTYLQVIKNEELLVTAQENVTINVEIFSKVQKLYNAGLTTLSEVNKVESSLSLARSNYVVQENTLLDVKYHMKRVIGKHLESKKMIRPDFTTQLPKTLEEATTFALTHNPSLLVSDYNIKLEKATLKEKDSSYYPSIDIEISQSFNKNLSAIEGTDNRFRAMINLKYNIFNGYADQSSVLRSKSKINQELQSKDTLKREVIEGLELSWSANEKLTLQLKHLQDYKKFSAKTLTLYSKEYALGRRSLLDLLSAQNDLIASKSQIITTSYSILFAQYRILDALGLLVSSIIKTTDDIYSNVELNTITPKSEG